MEVTLRSCLVVGCGYLGRRAAARMVKKGISVFGTTRSELKMASLRADGIQPVLVDLYEPKSFENLPQTDAIVLSPAPDTRDDEDYQRLYADGIARFLKCGRLRPDVRVIYTSSTGVYGSSAEGWVDETTAPAPDSTRSWALLAAESAVLQSPFHGLIFRLAGIYGPGRHRIRDVVEGRWPTEDVFANLIHVDDAAEALLFLLERSEKGQIFLGVDTTPVGRIEMYQWLAEKLGVASPASKAPSGAPVGRRCSSQKLQALGFRFRYPTYQDGYLDLIKESRQQETQAWPKY